MLNISKEPYLQVRSIEQHLLVVGINLFVLDSSCRIWKSIFETLSIKILGIIRANRMQLSTFVPVNRGEINSIKENLPVERKKSPLQNSTA